MAEIESRDELRGAACLARECAVTGQALALAKWLGSGSRPVTARQVLRKSDVAAAGAVLGVSMPARLRTAADVRALHRPWTLALAAGLVRVSDGLATAGAVLGTWPPEDEELLAGWLAGLRAVCAAESFPQDPDSVRLLVRALLVLLNGGEASAGKILWRTLLTALETVCDTYDKSYWEPLHAADRFAESEDGSPLEGLVTLLGAFGAVTGGRSGPRITPLGRWACGVICADLPAPADPGLPAAGLIAEVARFGDEEQRSHVAGGWLAGRDAVQAAREILLASDSLSPLLRTVAAGVVEGLGDDALPAWRELAAAPRVGPHARAVLAAWDQGTEPSEDDWNWLAVEAAAAAAEGAGPDEALSRIWESLPGSGLNDRLAAVRATGHPDAEALARALTAFAESGQPRSVDQAVRLKVSLANTRPPVWRRVELPATATLGDLHAVIQVLFGWDGDHLHVFTVGKRRYCDPRFGLDECGDEDELRLRDALAPGAGEIAYTYDLGACWRHGITLEKTARREEGRVYPVCLEYQGDSPVEYWSEDDPSGPEPFSLPDVNRRLARFG